MIVYINLQHFNAIKPLIYFQIIPYKPQAVERTGRTRNKFPMEKKILLKNQIVQKLISQNVLQLG